MDPDSLQIGVCERCAAGMRARLIQVVRHSDVHQLAATAHELTSRKESEKFKYLHKLVSSFELPGKLKAKQHKGHTASYNLKFTNSVRYYVFRSLEKPSSGN